MQLQSSSLDDSRLLFDMLYKSDNLNVVEDGKAGGK